MQLAFRQLHNQSVWNINIILWCWKTTQIHKVDTPSKHLSTYVLPNKLDNNTSQYLKIK